MSDIWTSAWTFRKHPTRENSRVKLKEKPGDRVNVEITHRWRVVMTPELFDGLEGSFDLNRILVHMTGALI